MALDYNVMAQLICNYLVSGGVISNEVWQNYSGQILNAFAQISRGIIEHFKSAIQITVYTNGLNVYSGSVNIGKVSGNTSGSIT